MAVPTAILPTPFFTRMTPVRAQDLVFLALSMLLLAGIGATYGVPHASATCHKRTLGGGILGAFAIGCPVCNKIVVALLGVSGALTYWAPLQPIVGLGAIVVLGWALHVRLAQLVPGNAAAC